MTRLAVSFLTLCLLSACAVHEPGRAVSTPALTASEFRNAAAGRISWRDPALAADASAETWVRAKILGFNDFHGNLNHKSIDGFWF